MYHPPKSSLSNKLNRVFAFLYSVNTHTHPYTATHNYYLATQIKLVFSSIFAVYAVFFKHTETAVFFFWVK